MANLTIRGVDKEIVDALKIKAKANHRSLESEIRLLLERHGRHLSGNELVKQAQGIAAMSPRRQGYDSTELLREDRNR